MKILHTVQSYLPKRHGMSEVVRQLSERMVELGHEVTVATSFEYNRNCDTINGVKVKSFRIHGNIAQGIEGNKDEYQKILLSENFDIITNFAAQQWATDLCLDLLDKIEAKKIFVPTGFSALNNADYREYFNQMKGWVKKYDMNIFLSNNYRDINFARINGVSESKIIVIPNAACEREFKDSNTTFDREKYFIPAHSKIILHIGSYTRFKGHEEALDIYLNAHNDDTVLVFVGQNFKESNWFAKSINFKEAFLKVRSPGQFLKAINSFNRAYKVKTRDRGKRIFLLQLNREELISLYKEANLFLFPSMIECSPVVLFEAMASKTPFLTTNVGNAKEIETWSNSGKIIPTTFDRWGNGHADIGKATAMLNEMLGNEKELAKMANSGYEAWKKSFTWKEITKQYLEIYKKVLS